MASNIINGGFVSNRPYGYQVWRFEPGTLTGTVDMTVATLPAGTIILDAALVCVRGDTGATTTTIDVEIGATGAGDTSILTGASDNAGAAGTVENTVTEANLTTINGVSLGGSALVVNAEITFSGTATVAPLMELHLLCGRFAV